MRTSALVAALLAAAVTGCGGQGSANKSGNSASNSSEPAAVEGEGENGTAGEGAAASGTAAAEIRAALIGTWGPQSGCSEQSMTFEADGSVTNSIGEAPGSGQWELSERADDVILNVEINGESDPAVVTLEDGALRIRPISGDAGAEGLVLHRCGE